jgi:hypothetical protein
MPRCYHRVKNEILDSRLHDMKLVYNTPDWHVQPDYTGQRACGQVGINTFLDAFATATSITKRSITDAFTAADGSVAGEEHMAATEKHVQVLAGTDNFGNKFSTDNTVFCLYKRTDWYSTITAANFWKAFDIFDKQYIIEKQIPNANIPKSLRGLMADLF